MRALRFLLLGLLLATSAAWAQAYPDKSRPLKILVPFGVASSTDLLARALARGISEVSGMNAFVENKAGQKASSEWPPRRRHPPTDTRS
jgi:tripartite-type tricarboxylate transporter receptor subunit TctC